MGTFKIVSLPCTYLARSQPEVSINRTNVLTISAVIMTTLAVRHGSGLFETWRGDTKYLIRPLAGALGAGQIADRGAGMVLVWCCFSRG